MFKLIFNKPNSGNWSANIQFIEKTINAQVPDHLNDSELFELVKNCQFYAYSRNFWKHNKDECHFSYGWYFTEKTVIAKPVDCEFSKDTMQEVLRRRNTLLRQAKSYIDDNLCTAKVNFIAPTKYNFTQLLSIKEIWDQLKMFEDDYYRSLPISKDEDLELSF